MTSPISSDWTPEDDAELQRLTVADRGELYFINRLARYALWQRGQINELRAENESLARMLAALYPTPPDGWNEEDGSLDYDAHASLISPTPEPE